MYKDKPIFGEDIINYDNPLAPDVLCLPFNRSLVDLTDNGLNGFIAGSLTWQDGLTFDGNQANYVSIPDLPAFFAGATEFTIHTRTRWGSSSADESLFNTSEVVSALWYLNTVLLFGDDIGTVRNDCVSFYVAVNGTSYRLESAAGVKAAGVETDIIITFKDSTMRMFINGKEDVNSPVAGPSAMDTGFVGNAWIGLTRAASGNRNPHQGSVDFSYIDSRAYTASGALWAATDPHSFYDPGFNPAMFGGLGVPSTTIPVIVHHLRQQGIA